ncbi:IS4 family transposase [Gemmata sp. JC673]|uniref:IS4 family transposase n=1 Tax=Gemmata algarum TaxID=2975278 RepID=A0ABU5EVT3_9BACT|nr:IS4 family transposase [Gemmata algarum]MDY3559084.1 IS4 family transposase [Gemmata algarum]
MTAGASDPGERESALERLCAVLDPDVINGAQPTGAAAVYTPWVVLWLMVYQRLHANASLAQAVAALLGSTDLLPPNRRVTAGTLSANTAAYSQARSRLRSHIPDDVADRVFDTLVAGTAPSLGTRRVFVVDGTTITLAPTAELQRVFPPATNGAGTSAWPVWHWVVAHELASGCAIRPETGPMYGPERVSELALGLRLLSRLPPRSVLLADRNFGVFAFAHGAKQAGHEVLTRLTEARFRAWVKGATAVAPGVWKRAWEPSRWDRHNHPELPARAELTVWLHEVRVSDARTLWLVTTLDRPSAELADLYRHRQDVETDIRDVKRTLKLEELRGRSVDTVRKELSAGLVAYNLVVQVRRLAAARAGVAPRRLSFAGTWSLTAVVLLSRTTWSAAQWDQKFEWVLRGAAQRKVPERPGRTYPRTVIRRARKFPNRPRSTLPDAHEPQPPARTD